MKYFGEYCSAPEQHNLSLKQRSDCSFTGQTYDELLHCEEDIRADLEAETAADPEFHSAVLRRLVLFKAKARLRELHAMLRSRSKSAQINKADVPKAMGWREEVNLYTDTQK